jgi:UDP-N-acetylglucosamine--N-acetylmuramyl-(pentapeptide) pyrophosphoryl-undecaprenol N-acetylglucosamine transferase
MRLLIAGGGTGGHLFPGIAVAEEFLARSPENQVLFMGTEKGIEAKLIPSLGYRLALIRSRGLVEKALFDRLKALLTLPVGLLQAMRCILQFRPDFALGVGGYSSGPALLAAWTLRVPCAIQEQNTVPGMTNRILSRIADGIFISFEESRSNFEQANKNKKIILTGNPIRKAVLKTLTQAEKAPNDNDNSRFCLLILGGSQGAHGINQLMMSAIPILAKYRDGLKVIHQTGARDEHDVAGAYLNSGFSAEVQSFIQNLEEYLVRSDLVISRAGAGAVAEIALSGRPSILIPFPYAAGDHQTKNAAYLVRGGAALLLSEAELTGEKLAGAIERILQNEDARKEMALRARSLARPHAAAQLVDEIYALVKESAGIPEHED